MTIEKLEITKAITAMTSEGYMAVQIQSLGVDGNLGSFLAHHMHGFRSQPRDMDADESGADALIGYEGGRGHAWILEDGRNLPLLPDEGKGGSLQYAVTEGGKVSYVKVSGADGSLVAHVDASSGPIRLEHGDDGPSVEVNNSHVELGGAGGADVVVDDGSLTAFFLALSQFTGINMPGGFKSSVVRAKK